MGSLLERFPLLRRVPVVAIGLTFGCVLAFVVFSEPVVQARTGAAASVSACGGEGQRACCALENAAGACVDGLVRQTGCTGDCACPDLLGNASTTNASDTCVAPATCGGEGQPACANGLDRTCNAGLSLVPGCSGNCNVQNGNAHSDDGASADFTCASLPAQPMDEPTTDSIGEALPVNSCSLAGYADLHLHLFSDLAHGGAVLSGKPYDYGTGGGVNEALGPDFTTDRALEKGGDPVPAPVLCDQTLYGAEHCGNTFFHGDHDLLKGDSIGAGTQDGSGSNFGAPIFNGWPKWTSSTHQQAYYKWLERAHQGGLRLVSMLAVTNEALCRGSRTIPGVDCEDSMGPIYQQIAAAKEFEQWLNDQGRTWFKIVYTPAEARLAIARGQLAVVLGVETAELFNCKFPITQCSTSTVPLQFGGSDSGFLNSCTFSSTTNGRPLASDSQAAIPTCTPASIDARVQELFNAGVRHVFPVHNFDNAFGGSATWQTAIEIGNRAVEGHWWKTRECKAEGYDFKLGKVFDAFSQALIGIVGFGQVFAVPVKPEDASCNDLGLLPLGHSLLKSLMTRGMIIDIDHLSVRALDDTLDIMESPAALVPGRTTPYPVVASHVLLREGHESTLLNTLHERLRTKPQLERIRDVGGMIAAMLKDDVQDTDNKGRRVTPQLAKNWVPSASRFAIGDDCRHSSKSFAVAYMNLAWIMGRPIAFGSDFNGTAGHFGPRFGSEGCGGKPPLVIPNPFDQAMTSFLIANDLQHKLERVNQYRLNQRVDYPFDLPGFGSFFRQVTGKKVFDYNFDGLAHIGLLPDFVQDLKVIGMDTAQGPAGQGSYVNMMFNSAEEYIRVWEKSLGVEPIDACEILNDTDPPAVQVTVTPPPNAAGWHKSNVTVTWQVTDPSGVATKSGCDATTLTTNTLAEGTTLTCTATDAAGRTAQQSVTIRLDKTAPDIAFDPQLPAPNANGWNNTPVTIDAHVSDHLSGLTQGGFTAVTTRTFNIDTSGQVQSVTATDVAGNTRLVLTPTVRIDRVLPTISFGPATPAANGNGWNNTQVDVPVFYQDDRSGIEFPGHPGGMIFLTVEGVAVDEGTVVFDKAGNLATRTTPAFKIDRTPPVVTSGRSPLANAQGWNNADVTAQFSATDALSGVAAPSTVSIVRGEGAGQSASHVFTDLAGNTKGATVSNINVDKTAPTITAARAPLANEHGWNNVNVTASFTCSDALSGLAAGACPGNAVMSAEAAAQSRNGTVTDLAGNSASASVTDVNIDKTAPAVTGARVTPANGFGWNKTTVRSAFSATDGLSGVLGPAAADVDLAAEGANQVASRAFSDRADNTASASVGGIHIDLTAPTIAGSRAPLANGFGWNKTGVTVSFACNDGLSGVDSCTADQPIATEGANQSRGGQVSDKAGNTAATSVGNISIDLTAPTIAGSRAPLANGFGWNNTGVAVSFACNDGLSGIDTCPGDQPIATEGANQSRSGQVSDRAGNTAATSVGNIHIDLTAPTIAGSRAPLANGNGWNNTDVTVSFACNDGLSGVDLCTANQSIATEGVNQSRAGQVSDKAGNTAAASVGSIFIDKTAPLISGAPDRAPNGNNWYNANITVSFACSDALSGVGTCAPTPQVISEEGAGLSRSASVMDLAGNTNAATVGGINLDKTPPVVTCTNNAPWLWPPNHKMVTVTLGVGVNGGLSGAAGFTLQSATSNEPDNGLGDGDTANDIQGFSPGTADITGQLRAERSGKGNGRVYSVGYQGADLAGNVTPCTTTVVVAHDQSNKK